MKVFLIGCGDIARHHGRAVVRLGGQVIGGIDISQANADLVSQEFCCPCCGYEEIEENVVKADYVVISTPPTMMRVGSRSYHQALSMPGG